MKKLKIVVLVVFMGGLMSSCSSYTCPSYSMNLENTESIENIDKPDKSVV